MAQGVRSRTIAGAGAAWLLAACGGEAPAPPAPRAVDLATIADGDLVDAVLDECQRPLRGRLDRIAAVVQLPDAREVRLFAQLPDKLRAVSADGSHLLLGDAVYRLGADRVEAAPPDQGRLGPAEWEVAQRGGDIARVTLRPGTLLPAALTCAHGEVRFVDYLRTSTTWMVRRASLAGLGECALQFVVDDLAWTPDFFALEPGPPATGREPGTRRLPIAAGEPQSPVPFVVETAATDWIVVADPASWPARCERYAPLHAELLRQGQHVAGFPILWQEDGAHWLAAPFRRRPDGATFAAPAGWTIRSIAAGRWLVVYPPDGDFAARLADGERRLREALAAQHLTPRGAMLAQPFLHLEEGEPPADKLAAPVLRMSVQLQD